MFIYLVTTKPRNYKSNGGKNYFLIIILSNPFIVKTFKRSTCQFKIKKWKQQLHHILFDFNCLFFTYWTKPIVKWSSMYTRNLLLLPFSCLVLFLFFHCWTASSACLLSIYYIKHSFISGLDVVPFVRTIHVLSWDRIMWGSTKNH